MLVWRLLHIFSAVFIAGYYMMMVPLIMPRLKRLGPAVQGPFMQALTPAVTPVMMISVVALVASGIGLLLGIRQGDFSGFFANGWGWAITLGSLIAAVAITIAWGVIMPTGIQAQKLAGGIQGRPPTPAEVAQMGKYAATIEKMSKINFVLIILALLLMVLARYI